MRKDVSLLVDKYDRVKSQRISKLEQFLRNDTPFLVHLNGACSFYGASHTIEESFNANIADLSDSLEFCSDTLPYIEPWFGTGIYAEAFGCEYFWRENDTPACHYKYKRIDEIVEIKKPEIADCKMLNMVRKGIEYFVNETEGRLPICLTDTQSANDIATLILDAVEVFTASYSDPENLHKFLRIINELVIEFSLIQKHILKNACTMPGHIMAASTVSGRGISISDDNLAVCSPKVNSEFLLPYDIQLGRAMGGVAIHSCGNWGHTMPIVAEIPEVLMIDCALAVDPSPNVPEVVRDAFKGSDKIVQVRVGADIEAALDLLRRLWASDLKLIVNIDGLMDRHEYQYKTANDLLSRLYEC